MIFVFGKTGQVATELQRQADVMALGRDRVDLSDPEACARAIQDSGAQCVINAAAYTAVDRAETEEALAYRINADAPIAMARACAALKIPFLHISTDYVFDGSGTQAWSPKDTPAPLNAYGRSKLAGEKGIANVDGHFAILRTSWVVSAHGANFVKTMLRLAQDRDSLNIVDDQIGGPTPAADIAAALLEMARQMMAGRSGGLYHFGGAPWVSWRAFAAQIFALSGHEIELRGITSAQYPTPAARPLNSRLDSSDLYRAFGIEPPDWIAGLKCILQELEGVQ